MELDSDEEQTEPHEGDHGNGFDDGDSIDDDLWKSMVEEDHQKTLLNPAAMPDAECPAEDPGQKEQLSDIDDLFDGTDDYDGEMPQHAEPRPKSAGRHKLPWVFNDSSRASQAACGCV